MHFTVTVHHGPEFLLVAASGPAVLADLCGYLDLVGTIAAQSGYHRAVLNLLDVDIALTFTEHLQLGAQAAERLRHLERVASVVSPQYRTGTSEKAAQKMGLRLRTFTALSDGLDWVREEIRSPTPGS